MGRNIFLTFLLLIPLVLILVGFLWTYKQERSLNQKLFIKGSIPKNLSGFYKGSPKKAGWEGKIFNATSSSGINKVNGLEKYPFKTYISKGVRDNIEVLKIDYNVNKNPLILRTVLDELVEVGEGRYLGKVHLRFGPLVFTLGFFRLETNVLTLKSPDYQIVLLGDSMTERLGNSDELQTFLRRFYSGKTFLILNYGFGSTNILSAMERLEKETFYGRAFMPILDIDFDLILIESFGHNPLSEFSLEEGLRKQVQALDKIVETIKNKKPSAKIVFVATIAPNTKTYAKQSRDLSNTERAKWANERLEYIKNHIEYAKNHNILLVNIYEKSLKNGDGNLNYIDSQDNIHPSPKGIYLISEEIANFIYQNNLIAP